MTEEKTDPGTISCRESYPEQERVAVSWPPITPSFQLVSLGQGIFPAGGVKEGLSGWIPANN